MTAIQAQQDLFVAAQGSARFVREITAVLSQDDVHLQAVVSYASLLMCLNSQIADRTLPLVRIRSSRYTAR